MVNEGLSLQIKSLFYIDFCN